MGRGECPVISRRYTARRFCTSNGRLLPIKPDPGDRFGTLPPPLSTHTHAQDAHEPALTDLSRRRMPLRYRVNRHSVSLVAGFIFISRAAALSLGTGTGLPALLSAASGWARCEGQSTEVMFMLADNYIYRVCR